MLVSIIEAAEGLLKPCCWPAISDCLALREASWSGSRREHGDGEDMSVEMMECEWMRSTHSRLPMLGIRGPCFSLQIVLPLEHLNFILD
jgi:hypothetical protein